MNTITYLELVRAHSTNTAQNILKEPKCAAHTKGSAMKTYA